MKAFKGKEILHTAHPPYLKQTAYSTKHEVLLEDDGAFLESLDKEEIWCKLDPEEARQIIEFINKAQILGIDNSIINKAYELKNLLKKYMG